MEISTKYINDILLGFNSMLLLITGALVICFAVGSATHGKGDAYYNSRIA